ncbi:MULTISPECIES: hypothetical protein [Pseudomonas]|uniref:Uncharacterized protein n=1 Tax=Pseudomonas wuhanensis TaxID=2954098 RepID=A0ABY9GLC9_9PSED|nr:MULTISPECIES: hypothetical protein [unclassified Pseudomonas]WLI10732.1 hypothetical protein PSH65_21245 [Pseudomonas sp. FP603]WLI16549.1 hypothetical protein PSH88_19870 [Pseudomonas sp. FP607]
MSNEKDAYEAAQRLRALDQGESRSGFSGPALPSGSTVSSAPYQVPSLSSRSGPTSEGQPPKRRGATDNQINAHLHNDDGSLRTASNVASALHAAGLGAENGRITARLQAAGGARKLPGATDAQIDAHLHNDDGSLRTQSAVASALHAAGLGADQGRIAAALRAAGGARHLRGATDAQINAHLHNDDGSLRTRRGVVSALHAAGLGASTARITARRQAAGGARHLRGATDAQINAHLRNTDGSLRTQRAVASALHAAGLGADTTRIRAQLQAARGPQ